MATANRLVVIQGLSSALILDRHGSSRATKAAGPTRLRRADGDSKLPGQPWVDLTDQELLPHLRKAFLVERLDKIVKYLWLAGTPSEEHISCLHHQYVRGREAVITEEPGLHLVWYHNRIFIKPLPQYLLCAAFWDYIKEADENVWRAAAGFMRTYCYLIRSESDYRRATQPGTELIPMIDGAVPTFESFVYFISQFKELNNSEVAERYSYGMLRLTRLNYLALFTMGRLTYFHIQPQWIDYIGGMVAPAVTLFLLLSTILNSMQVGLAVEGLQATNPDDDLPLFEEICRVAALGTILLVTIFMVTMLAFLVSMMVKEAAFGRSMLREKKKEGKSKDYHAIIGV